MGFFFCPKFLSNLWSRKSSTAASETSQSHQLTTIKAPTNSDLNGTEGDCSIDSRHVPKLIGSGLSCSTGYANYSEHQTDSDDAFSHILRKRYSNKPPMLKGRSSLFGFSTKFPKLVKTPISAVEVESSLMSERAYDSDAHFIVTPKQTIGRASKLTQPNIRDYIYEPQSLEEPEWELPLQQSSGPLGEGNPLHEQDDRNGRQITSQLQHNPGFQQINQEHAFGGLSHGPKILHAPGPIDTGTRAVMHEAENSCFHRDLSDSTGSTRYYDSEDQYREPSGHDHISSSHTITPALSGDSLLGPCPQLSVRKKRQKLQTIRRPDYLSVHLGDIDIPRILASPSLSSQAISQDYPLANQADIAGAPYQYDDLEDLGNVSRSSEVHIQQDKGVSTPYSRTSLLSGPYKYRFESRVFSHLYRNAPDEHTVTPPIIDEANINLNCRVLNGPNAACPSTGLDKKAKELPEKDTNLPSSISPQPDEVSLNLESSRQVSVGWMTGGRRLGYGYTLVTGNDESLSPREIPGSSGTCNSGGPWSKVADPNGTSNYAGSSANKKPSSRTSDSTWNILTILRRFNLHRWLSKRSSTKKNPAYMKGNSDAPSEGIFGLPKSQSDVMMNTNANESWRHPCGVDMETMLGQTQGPRRETIALAGDTKSRLTRGRTLRRARSLWPGRRRARTKAVEIRTGPREQSFTQPTPDFRRSKSLVITTRVHDRTTSLIRGKDEESAMSLVHDPWDPLTPQRPESQLSNPTDNFGEVKDHMDRASSDSGAYDWAGLYRDCMQTQHYV